MPEAVTMVIQPAVSRATVKGWSTVARLRWRAPVVGVARRAS